MNDQFLKFPDDFLWGTSTSAYQVEGGIENCDWSKVYPAGRACDHYHRCQEDFDLAKCLNQNVHRFSIEWSRIEPQQGKFNQREIEHYRKVLLALKRRDIKSFVTLWHWTIPLWLADIGGWSNKKAIDCFNRYTEKICSELKDNVEFWIILNEPLVYASNSCLRGIWPPKEKNLVSYFLVIKNLIKAHKSAFKIIKKINPNAQVGIAKNNVYFESYKNRLFNCLLKKIIDWHWNFYFLNQIRNCQDFIGLNYYFHNRINYGFGRNENKINSDMGWELYPEGVYYVLKELKRYRKPIYITENGLADAKDEKRTWYIKGILRNIHRAIQEGVDVKGYLYWSLLDNFEWDKGFKPRFGLIEINYKNLERKARTSAFEYAKIIKENGFYINK